MAKSLNGYSLLTESKATYQLKYQLLEAMEEVDHLLRKSILYLVNDLNLRCFFEQTPPFLKYSF